MIFSYFCKYHKFYVLRTAHSFDKYPQSMLTSMYTIVNKFYYIKMSSKGVKITFACKHDVKKMFLSCMVSLDRET